MNNWEITIQELQTKEGKKYKVTRRLPEYFIAETKRFISKEEALKQIELVRINFSFLILITQLILSDDIENDQGLLTTKFFFVNIILEIFLQFHFFENLP